MTVRYGIVGLGRMGKRHAENLALRVPGAALVAACSPVAEELAYARDTLQVSGLHERYEDLLARKDVDAVFIVTPNALHPENIVAALRAGKHVFCEKPLGMDVKSCEMVEAEAAKHPRQKAMIGYVRRFDESYEDAYRRVADGQIGTPFLVRAQTTDQNDPSGFFVRFAPQSGGIFVDMSVHDTDLVRWLLGAPKALRVFATGTIAVHEGLRACGDIDNGIAIVEFAGGKSAVIYASRTMPHGHETTTEVIGTTGRLMVGRGGNRNRVEIADASGIRTETTPTFYERFADAFLREAMYFTDCVAHDRTPALTLHDATEATRIAVALRTSLVERRVVDIA
ncbi:MAG TPA: Gfo/Idh/MocA family oxidoreductase [Casimicrobiaceae bacterium]|nr:Gfo/Idh/MocA family oxidoreductase [Casimicrobiaceae bacterium]